MKTPAGSFPSDPTKTFLRSFLVQSSWNYRGMQNLGLASMTVPVMLRKRCGAGKEPPHASTRLMDEQTEFFNAHPYFSGAIAAMCVADETLSGDADEIAERQRRIKADFMGPLGGLGDQLFWQTALPVCGALGVIVAMFGRPLAGALVFLASFNALHLPVRYGAIAAGFSGRGSFIAFLQRLNLPRFLNLARRVILLMSLAVMVTGTMWLAGIGSSFAPALVVALAVLLSLGPLAAILGPWWGTILFFVCVSLLEWWPAFQGGKP